MPEAALANGPITQWLAIVGAVSLMYWAWRIGAALTRRGKPTEAPAPAAAPPPSAPTHDADIAVIAAAVFATLGAHRIVHLEAEGRDQTWAVEGRWMQQTSHSPHA